MTDFTARQKHIAIKRELGFRQHVYPKRIADGKLTQKEADFQIGIFEAIAADYAKIADAEEKAGRLL